VTKSLGNQVNFFLRTLNLISEQQAVVCCRRKFTEECNIFFSSRIFYGTPRTSVFLPEGKSRALVYLHIFTFILLAIVPASYLSFQKVFLTLNNYLHLNMVIPYFETVSGT